LSLFPGNRIGPYEIRALIGAGGMGEVYRATDSRLGRDVAIKMLPVEVAADAERLGRFRREAQVLASLNHPNIAAIHGLEDAGGTPCLVLELVEGEDLAQRLARGPIPPDEAIDIARHIAEALEEAHEKGIVHRDLKPANVKVTPDGKVKVLDFGLAKALTGSEAAGAAGSDLSQSPTLVQSGTRAGMILGTAAYMSPEQARGRAVDRRADIWAFGAVLWEMLTGTALFAGETITDVLAAVLTRDPDWSALPPSTPPRLAALLRRCLERDPRRRLQAMGEARLALEPGSGVHEVVAAPVRPARSRGLEWPAALGLALVGAAIGVAVLLLLAPGRQAPGAAPPRLAFGFDPPAGTSFVGGVDVSRDGRSIVFVARDAAGQTALWLRDLDAVEPRRLSGTDGARFPFWSPDGRRLGFFAGSQMKSVDLIGGAVKMIVRTTNTADVRGASWGADDVIVFAPTFHGPLFRITASGGKPEPATSVDGKERTHRWPCFLPDGRHFLFYEAQGSGMEPGETRLGIVGSTATRTLGPSNSRVAFLPPRKVLYARGRTLVAQELDVDRATLLGEPQALGLELPGSLGIAGFRYLAAAAPETLVTRFIESNTNQLVWLDRQGKVLSVAVDDGGWHNLPRLSPDGRRIAVAHYAGENNQGDIHVHDLDRHLDTRVTFDDDDDQEAVWSPDGRTLAVTTGSETQLAIVLVDPARPGEKRLVRPVPAGSQLEDWFPDGSLLLATGDDSGRSDLIRLPAGGGEPVKVVSTPFSEASPSLTPDGRWLAYVSDSTGREEVYVRSLGSGEEWRVSGQGGTAPTWRRDGRELFYLDFRGFIMAVPTTIGATFTMGAPQALFPGLLDDSSSGRQFDVTADGQRFLVRRSSETTPQPILVHLGLPEPGRIGP
jgi:Tol biopolymer transport system component